MKKSGKNPSLTGRPLSEKISLWLAFGCGSGFIRPAPGTWGTLPGVFIAYFVMPYPLLHLAVIIALTLIGTWLCQRASAILGVHDHGGIVIDEIVGVLITLWLFQPTWQVLLLGFIAFRVFDILKPWPIRWVDKHVHGGWGIMLDDIIAAGFAWVTVWVITRHLYQVV
ncbi:MAG: phosphatidylglycerophosphatase A [Gammaproteobacteria bacterium]|nr:MAG: phosphatidylglycerophosphatase A [Gammaproteobacteria bacterium]